MTLIGFAATLDASGGMVTLVPVSDSMMSVVSTNYFKTSGKPLVFLVYRGATAEEVRLSGSWDTVPLIESENFAVLAADLLPHEVQHIHVATPVDGKLSCKITNGASEASGVIVGVGDDQKGYWGPAPAAPFKVIQVVSTTAGVAYTWVTCAMTYPADLPAAGVMTVLGMRCKSASGYGIRVVQGERTGIPVNHALQGEMFWFNTPLQFDLGNLPSFEILSSTTTAAHNLELAVQYSVPK